MRIEVFKKFSPGVISLLWMDIKHIVLSWSNIVHNVPFAPPCTRTSHKVTTLLFALELIMEQQINELGRISAAGDTIASENNGFADENIDGFHREMR